MRQGWLANSGSPCHVALLSASGGLKGEGLSQDEKVGYDIVLRACRSPIQQIAENAGQDGGVVVAKVRDSKGNFGYDALKDEYTDLVKAGIIDPTKVARTALQNAASVAGLALTTDVLITELKEKKGEEATPVSGAVV